MKKTRFPLPAAGLGQLLLRGREAMHLTLREVASHLSRKGETMPPSTLSRIEHGKLEPSVRRLFLLLDLYQLPTKAVGRLARKPPVTSVPPTPPSAALPPAPGARP